MKRKWKHGCWETRSTYVSWRDMRRRCYNSKHPRYKDYGARGITVCERWRDDYDAFYEDMGPRPFGWTLERKDNEKGYDPDNCIWATYEAQAQNRRAA